MGVAGPALPPAQTLRLLPCNYANAAAREQHPRRLEGEAVRMTKVHSRARRRLTRTHPGGVLSFSEGHRPNVWPLIVWFEC